jgi:hypothetical protein
MTDPRSRTMVVLEGDQTRIDRLAEGIAMPDHGCNLGTAGFAGEVVHRAIHKPDLGEALA